MLLFVGLTVILFLEIDEYLKGLTTGYGARVQFQKRDTYPFPKAEGVFISGAMETDIGLKYVSCLLVIYFCSKMSMNYLENIYSHRSGQISLYRAYD